MNGKGCSFYAIGLVVTIALTIYFFGRLLTINEFNPEQRYTEQTVTAIVATNQAVETYISQTATANVHEVFAQTVTPEPTETPTITPTIEMETLTLTQAS